MRYRPLRVEFFTMHLGTSAVAWQAPVVIMAISTPPGFDPFYTPAPLPGEDDLPCSDGEPMETEKHRRQMYVLTESLELALADRDDVYVGADMFVYFSELQIKKNDFRGPDVFVVLNTNRRVRKSWVVWQENDRRPDVVIELVSETTEDVDRGDKMRIYAKMLRVTNYYIFDPLSLQLDGYVLDPQKGEYVPLKPDARGELVCPPLGLRLAVRRAQVQGIDDKWLRWIDPQGNMLPTPEEQAHIASEQARLATDQAQHEARLRVAAEQRLADALAELERLKAAR